MKRIREWLSGQKWKEKLVVQLGVSILMVNLMVLLVCFVFQYAQVERILLEKDETDNVNRFIQSEYNINNFAEQVDVASRRFSLQSIQKNLMRFSDGTQPERIAHATQLLDIFSEMQTNYPYFKIMSFYCENGMILKSGKGDGYGHYVIEDANKEDWYYSSEIYRTTYKNKLELQWYGTYSEEQLGVYLGEEAKDNYYICAARTVMNNTGMVLIAIDMEYFLDIFFVNTEKSFENIYVIDQNNRIVAAKDTQVLGEERYFENGEAVQDGIYKYIEEGENGKNQVIVYELSSMGWSLVSETPVEEVTKESLYLRNILLMSCGLSVFVAFGFSMWWVSKILKPLKRLDEEMEKVSAGELGGILDNPPANEIGTVIRRYNQMSMDLKEMFRQNQEMEKEKRRLEMKTLRAQINPHLIYNVLNSIKWRAIFSNERNIAESVSLLAEFLQPVFKNQDILCTVEEELNYVTNYIAIMNLLRTGDFVLELAVPEEYYSWQMIRFLLQPVVENSILHGYSEENSGKIRISMRVEEKDGILIVEDDGEGLTAARLQEVQERLESKVPQETQGIGIANVNRRIKNQYGEGYGLTIRNREEGGAMVTLRILLEQMPK